jgi:hypothetical protein
MEIKKIALLILVFTNINLLSQLNNNYLPLNIGNTWVYYGTSSTIYCHNSSWLDKYKITGTMQANGKTYFTFSHQRIQIEGNCGGTIILFQNDLPIRVDTLTKNIYKKDNCQSLTEYLVDSLKSKMNDTAWSCLFPKYICSDTTKFYFCSDSLQSKTFGPLYWESGSVRRYALNTGLVYYYNYLGGGSGSEQSGLRGCVINGITCGDTSFILGLKPISSEIPQSYILEQNYPNPFNPSTKIRFSLPNPSKGGFQNVKLVIFDILGREIKTLVNEKLSPGIYEADFVAAELPSGIYFYRLVVTDASALLSTGFTDTKKMVLLK